MAGSVIPGFAPKLHMPIFRLIDPATDPHYFPDQYSEINSGAGESDNEGWGGIKISTNGQVQRVSPDNNNSYNIGYFDYSGLFTLYNTNKIPSDLRYRATDTESFIDNGGASAGYWEDGYDFATPTMGISTSGNYISDSLNTWLNISDGPHEWAAYANGGWSNIGKLARLKLEVESASFGWSVIYDFRITITSNEVSTGSPDGLKPRVTP